MSGSHREETPGDTPRDGGQDPAAPPYDHGRGGSPRPSDEHASGWFSVPEAGTPTEDPGGAGRSGGFEAPGSPEDWNRTGPRHAAPRPAYEADDPTGAPDPAGFPGSSNPEDFAASDDHAPYDHAPYDQASYDPGASAPDSPVPGAHGPDDGNTPGHGPDDRNTRGHGPGYGDSDGPGWGDHGPSPYGPPVYGAGGFTGASDPGGHRSGGFMGASDPGGYGLGRRATSAEDADGHGSDAGHGFAQGSGTGAQNGSWSRYGDEPGPYGDPGRKAVAESADSASGAGGSGDLGSGERPGGAGRGGHGGRGGRGGRADGERHRRSLGALIGPLAGALGLALLLGVGAYALTAGGGCGAGDTITLNVSAAPDIAPAVNATVTHFNDQKRKVNGHCVRAAVSSADPADVATLLSGQGSSGTATRSPDVWIPDSSLWTSMVRTSANGKDTVQVTGTSIAQNPLVVAMPQALVGRLRAQGVTRPSWDSLLKAAGGPAAGAVSKNQGIPSNLIKLQILDPARNAGGMASLMLTRMLLASDPNAQTLFTGIVRAVRDNVSPGISAQFASFGTVTRGRYPVVLTPEQAVWKHNHARAAAPAVAVHPVEGTVSLDYPYTVTTDAGDKVAAARLLGQALATPDAQKEVRARGFRSADGTAPASYGVRSGLDPKAPRTFPAPQPGEVRAVMQAWAKLSLSVRMLALLDVSGSMADVVPGTKVTRMQATAQVAQGGLSLLPNDTELGLWTFSTELVGPQDWREDVSMGPLGQRIGSGTRRQMVLAGLAGLRPKPTGNTGLYDSILAAFHKMKKSYKPEMINSLLLLTDGKNDDPHGISLQQLLATLNKEFDPNRPVQVIMIGFGKGVDRNELAQIARATRGSVHIAHTPQEIQKIFLSAISRRVCAPNC